MEQPSNKQSPIRQKGGIVALVALAGVALVVFVISDPIPQDSAYHRFVDTRRIWGIPNFGDVLSNLGFILVGLWGTVYLILSSKNRESYERLNFLLYGFFFIGLFLTGIGSAYYHWHPSNERLLWDRLPLTIAFMSLFCAVIYERISRRWAVRLFTPLLIIGAVSVLYWAWTGSRGRGDLRLYGLVQFYPMAAIPILLFTCRSIFTHGHYVWWALACYAAAKVCEHNDQVIYDMLKVLSGHNLKHILATGAPIAILLMLKRRTLRLPNSS